ncbi:MAG: MFS transporter [Gammaproteobacteria bacterium]|nr:MFS transporter [Gammaproteobacteria bacterium]MDH4314655.1 MFS transporter [Gammaproteobacteria bacterium]MDH5501007.1 MFS transporter [Gammaproteobacteria bacterium]
MSGPSQFRLLSQRRFAPFFATQFLGAFNDNVFRNGLIILITFQGVQIAGMSASELANVAGALFILPFFLFSATAGQLADKYEKSLLFRRIKLLEIALMLIAAFAFISKSYTTLLFVLFLMGCQSTLFGPVKYAYLPQQLATHELIGGNALVESGTYVAIILGLLVGGISVSVEIANQSLIALFLVAIAVCGYLASRSIPPTRAVDPGLRINWNSLTQTWQIVRFAREDRSVFLSIMGISWFWFFGSAITIQVPAYTLDILNGNEEITTILLVAFAVGVGIGALLCERLSDHRIELGLVPFGSIGLTAFAIDLYFSQPTMNLMAVSTVGEFLSRSGSWRILLDLAMLGAFGGFYSVPLYALIQQRADRTHLSRIIAANNIINSFFMVVAAILALVLLNSGVSIPQFFLVLAALNAVVAVYIYSLLPEFLIRFVVWILINVLYRIRPAGNDNIPKSGPAILVCNHVSFVDALIVGGSIRRPVRFVMYYKIFEIPVLRFLFKTAKAIPIAPAKEDETLLAEAFERIDAELAAGNLVCIFPEGAITRDGKIHSFRPGIEKIIERRPVPVIPIALSGLWGSWFSRKAGGGLRRIPGRLFAKVDVRIGEAVRPADATAPGMELLVRTLRGTRR